MSSYTCKDFLYNEAMSYINYRNTGVYTNPNHPFDMSLSKEEISYLKDYAVLCCYHLPNGSCIFKDPATYGFRKEKIINK